MPPFGRLSLLLAAGLLLLRRQADPLRQSATTPARARRRARTPSASAEPAASLCSRLLAWIAALSSLVTLLALWSQAKPVLPVAVGNVLVSLAAALLKSSRRLPKQALQAHAVQQDQGLSPSDAAAVSARLSGAWRKDNAASDPMDAAFDLIQLNWLLRQAVTLVHGLQLRFTADAFHLVVVSKIAWFKVAERYSLDGTPQQNQRRDLRGGGTRSSCTLRPWGIELLLVWEEPLAGREIMKFRLSEDSQTMEVSSSVRLRSGGSTKYTHVYRRQ